MHEDHLDILKFRKEENENYKIFRRGMLCVLEIEKPHNTPYILLIGERRNFNLADYLKEKNTLVTDDSIEVAHKLRADILDLNKLFQELILFDIGREDLKRLAEAL